MTYRRPIIFALAFGLLSAAYPSSQSRAADLSEPKSAAMAFATALMSDDVPGMHAAGIGNDEQWQVVEMLGKLVVAQKKLSEAATAKFGAAASMPVANPLKNAEEKLKDADVAINGDEATITAKKPEPGSQPVKLKREGGDWKVVLETMTSGMRNMSAGDRDKAGKMADAMGELAGEVEAGKYATVNELHQAMRAKLAAFMQPSRPSSAPAKR